MDAVLYVFAGLLGLAIGSFANVVIYRVPAGLSVVSPPSACPQCKTEILARDNVPVLGWVLLRGRCRTCGSAISARYPLVEAATAALFVVMAWRFGLHVDLVAFLYLAAIGVVLAMIDIDVKRLPDVIVKPSWVVFPVLLALAAVTDGSADQLLRAAVGAAGLGAFYLLLSFVYPAGMGWGDVKLSPILGAALGWVSYGSVVVGAFSGFLLGGVFGIFFMLVGAGGRKSKVPFGPFMLLGTLVGVLAGSDIAHAYLSTSGVA